MAHWSSDGEVELAREHEPGNQHEGFKAEKHVAVPASYNDLYAEEGFRMWKDGMWYQRTFAVPKTLKDERLVLRFGAVRSVVTAPGLYFKLPAPFEQNSGWYRWLRPLPEDVSWPDLVWYLDGSLMFGKRAPLRVTGYGIVVTGPDGELVAYGLGEPPHCCMTAAAAEAPPFQAGAWAEVAFEGCQSGHCGRQSTAGAAAPLGRPPSPCRAAGEDNKQQNLLWGP